MGPLLFCSQELLDHSFLRPTEYEGPVPTPAANLAALSMEQLKQLLLQVRSPDDAVVLALYPDTLGFLTETYMHQPWMQGFGPVIWGFIWIGFLGKCTCRTGSLLHVASFRQCLKGAELNTQIHVSVSCSLF